MRTPTKTKKDCKSDNHAKAMQKLYISLLFSEKTQNDWIKNPLAVLTSYKIPLEKQSIYPSMESEAFEFESRGRRLQVANELLIRYQKSLNYLHKTATDHELLLDSTWFKKFLDSEFFLTSKHSLPHPCGLGKGYENTSKFYFWNLNNRPTKDPRFFDILRKEFSIYILSVSKISTINFYKKFETGIFFKSEIYNDKSYYLLTSNKKIKKVRRPKKTLVAEGFFDLSTLDSM